MGDTNADDKLIGFEYQFYFFLLSLLKMNKGDLVGFEVKEDVHLENKNELILFQLKHTIQTNAKGEAKNLITSDSDLWKTLSLWINKANKEKNVEVFLKNTEFIFVSNKKDNEENSFLKALKVFKEDSNFEELKTFLSNYKEKLIKTNEKKKNKNEEGEKLNKDPKITYLTNILSFNYQESFFDKVSFLLDYESIKDEIKYELKYSLHIKSNFRINGAFNGLVGILKNDFYEKVKSREKVQYSKKAFSELITPLIESLRGDRLPFITNIDSYKSEERVLDKTFAKQLRDLEISDDDIYEYDRDRMLAEINIKELYQGNEIVKDDIKNFQKDTIKTWNPMHKKAYLKKINDEEKALGLFYDVLEKDLFLAGQQVTSKSISNGQFLRLSDKPVLGWKYTWEEYKDDE